MSISWRGIIPLAFISLIFISCADPSSSPSYPDQRIHLKSGSFDPLMESSAPGLMAGSAATLPENEARPRLVQFYGPIEQSDKEALLATGVELGDYIPSFCFIAHMTDDQRIQVEGLPQVRWTGDYLPEYKVSPEITSPGFPEDMDPVALTVQTFRVIDLEETRDAMESAGLNVLVSKAGVSHGYLQVETPRSAALKTAEQIAAIPGVEWVERKSLYVLHNDSARWVVQSAVSSSTPLWDHGLDGSGQIASLSDTGVDADMCYFWDASQGLPGPTVNLSQRKIISYHDWAGSGDWDGHDHGTHTSTTIAGDNLATIGAPDTYDGIAYNAKLVVQDIATGGSLVGIPSDLNFLFQEAYDDGARIHSNSWGADVYGDYTTESAQVDEFMWNHKDFLILFSAGNAGSGTGSIGSPATAKSLVTVGASENAHTGYNIEDVANFSSNGPTDDNRIKPTVMAPGYYLNSANNDGSVSSFNCGTRTMYGTSMSCPAAAGLATLVRQYFTDGYHPSGAPSPADGFTPSAALIKAVMTNSAVSMTGAYTDGPIPSTGQGWGRVLARNALHFDGDTVGLAVEDEEVGLMTGQSQVHAYYADGSDPLKVTLTWTDYPSTAAAAINLINDLNLTVGTPSGVTYLGNVFSGGVSTTGGSADNRNVVENVLLDAPLPGVYTVTVSAANTPQGPQPYALVVTGVATCTSDASIRLEEEKYGLSGVVEVSLSDCDLDIDSGSPDTVVINVVSTTETTAEPVSLTETGDATGNFSGSFTIASGAPAADGTLQVSDGDSITAVYTEVSPPGIKTATAVVDGSPPSISNVSAHPNADGLSALIAWDTDEASDSTVVYGISPALGQSASKPAMTDSHTVSLGGLTPSQTYYFDVQSTDDVGNVRVDDNGGAHYTFNTTPPEIDVYPASLSAVLHQGQVISDTLTISNLGDGADLGFNIEESGGAGPLEQTDSATTVKVLSYIQYADIDQEYAYTLDAIDQVSLASGIEYQNTTFSDYGQLSSLLPGNDVLLIPEQESASSTTLQTIGSSWATILQDFVDDGGVVVACDYLSTWRLINSTGLISITGYSTIVNYTVQVTDPYDPVATDLPSSYIALSGSSRYTTSDGNAVVSYSTSPVVIHKSYGEGHVVMIGHDYFSSNADQNKVVGNAVLRLAEGGQVSWLEEDPEEGAVASLDSLDIAVTFNAHGLDPGLYTANIVIENDDPDENPVTVPVDMTVTASPDIIIDSVVFDDDNLGDSSGDGDGIIEPMETVEVIVTLYNQGSLNATAVTAELFSPDPDMMVLDPSESFGDILSGDTARSLDDFDIVVSPLAPDGAQIPLDLVITDGTHQWEATVLVEVSNKSWIGGKVTRASSGMGVSGATINYKGPSTGAVVTDSAGYYLIGDLAGGTYQLRASAPNLLDSVTVTVSVPPSAGGMNFALLEPPVISGQVTSVSDGLPLPNASITYSGPDSGSAGVDASGDYIIHVSKAGLYLLTAQAPGHQPSDPVTVTVPPDATGTDFALLPFNSISGVVRDINTGLGVGGAQVSYSGLVSGSVFSLADGSYTIGDLVTGGYVVSAHAAGYQDSDTVSATVPPDATGIDLALLPFNSISGVVRDMNTGLGVGGAQVSYSGLVSGSVFSLADGSYTIGDLVSGGYVVSAHATGYQDSDTVSVTVPPDVTGLDLELRSPEIDVSPSSVSLSMLPNTVDNRYLTVSNQGSQDLGFTAEILPGASTQVVVFEDDMESGTGGWTHGGNYDEWELGFPSAGPGSAHSGTNCWGTDLNGNYSDNANQWLRSPLIDLTGFDSAQLSFWHWYTIESCCDDAILEVSTNGTTWTQLGIYYGYQTTWTEVTISLDAYVGQSIWLRFRLYTDYSVYYEGWYMDDFMVEGTYQPDLDWVSVSPEGDTVEPGESVLLDLEFDTGGLATGPYQASLSIQSNDPDEADLTVPIDLTVALNAQHLSLVSSVIDDDTAGESSGNGDGWPDLGETIELIVTIENDGPLWVNNILATLSTGDPYVTITDNSETFGNISPGAQATCADDFDFIIDPGYPPGHVALLLLEMVSGSRSWQAVIYLHAGPQPEIDVAPPSVSETVVQNATKVFPLTVTNNGQALLDFLIEESGAGSTVLLQDTFPTTTIDPGKWVNSGSAVNTIGLNPPSPPYSLDVNGTDQVTSVMFNTSAFDIINYEYYWERQGGGNSPESGENLNFEWWNGASWVPERVHTYTDGFVTIFTRVEGTFPSSASFNGFRVRFRTNGTAGDYDDYPVDNVTITGISLGIPWLSEVPESDTVSPAAGVTVDLIFSAQGMPPGVFSGSLDFISNDPDDPVVTVPVTMTVVVGPQLAYLGHVLDDDTVGGSVGDGDGYAEAGEIVELTAGVINGGTIASTSVSVRLETDDPYLAVSGSPQPVPDLAPGDSAWTSGSFILTVDPFTPHLHVAELELTITDSTGCQWGHTITITLYNGPDIEVNPPALAASAREGSTTSIDRPLVVSNAGGSDLIFTAQTLGDTVDAVAFDDDMESGVGGWTHGGAYDEWELGNPTGGPGSAHSGANCWGTDLDATYQDDADQWLKSPPISLANGESITLSFWHWYSIETGYDDAMVEVSTDGSSWTQLSTYTGYQTAWTEVTVSLDAYAGQTIWLRFRLETDYSVVRPGWYIDDVRVEMTGSGLAWLDLMLDSGTVAPGDTLTITASFDPAGLDSGTYTGFVAIDSNDLGNNPLFVPVTFTIEPSPQLELAYYLIDDDASGESSGNGNGVLEPGETAELLVELFNSGGADASSVTGTLATGDVGVVIVDSDEAWNDIPFGGWGVCLDDFDFSVDAGFAQQSISFDLTVMAASTLDVFPLQLQVPVQRVPEASVSPASVSAALFEGAVSTDTVTVYNLGSDDLVVLVSASTPQGWLGAAPAFFVVPPGSSREVQLTFDATLLSPGTYNTDLAIFSNDLDEPMIYVPVDLTVNPGSNLSIYDLIVDDDNIGSSQGDGDGRPEPGERIELGIVLENQGSAPAPGVEANLIGFDPSVVILSPTVNYGDIAPASSASGSAYLFKLDNAIPNMTELSFQLDITTTDGRSFSRGFEFMIEALYRMSGMVTETLSGTPLAGAQVAWSGPTTGSVSTAADGSYAINGLDTGTYTLTVSLPNYSTGVATASFPPDNQVMDFTLDGPAIEFSPDQVDLVMEWGGGPVEAIVKIHDLGALDLDYQVTLHDDTAIAGGGPDGFGYRFYDNASPAGPLPQFLDISGDGTTVSGWGDDVNLGPFDIGFDFPFYGQTFDSFRICSNGWISFTDTSTSFSNRALPDPLAPRNLVAPFWTDLDLGLGGEVYYKSDPAGLVVEFSDVRDVMGGGPYTFEAVLLPSGAIRFEYLQTQSSDRVTVGVQNAGGDMGLTVVHNDVYLDDTTSIIIAPGVFWMAGTPLAGTVPSGSFDDLALSFDFRGLYLSESAYSGHLEITSTDAMNSPLTVPVSVVLDHFPEITTSPGLTAYENSPYACDVDAFDADGDTLTWSLETAPAGMGIDAATGLIGWVPVWADVGAHAVTVLVEDVLGGQARQSYTLNVMFEDNDGDGLPDTWETSTGLDPGNSTGDNGALGDPDGDGISNMDEYLLGLDPLSSNAPSAPSVNFPFDGEEVTLDQPLLSINNASDPDGDTLDYTFEVYADPGLSVLVAGATAISGGTTTAEWLVPLALDENTRYYWRARAADPLVNGPWMAAADFFVNVANDPPGAVAVSSPGDYTQVSSLQPVLEVTETTDPDLDPLQYVIEVYLGFGFTALDCASAPLPHQGDGLVDWTVPAPLTENQWYCWAAWAVDDEGLAGPEAQACFQVNSVNLPPLTPALMAPEGGIEIAGLDPPLIVENTIDPDGDAVSYRFQIDKQNSFSSPALQDSSTWPETQPYTAWIPSTLEDNTWYYWRVLASDGSARSAWSPARTFMVNLANDPPADPVPMQPADGGQASSELPMFEALPATDVDGDSLSYVFVVYADASMTTLVEQSDPVEPAGGVVQWTPDDPLEDGGCYYWRVWAVDEFGLAGPPCALCSFQVACGNSPPAGVYAVSPKGGVAVDSTRPELTVSNAVDPDGDGLVYEFQLFEDPGLTIMIAGATAVTEGMAESSWPVTVELVRGRTYYWRARAFDGEACSSWTATASFMVATPEPSPVTKVKVEDKGGCGCAMIPGPAATQWGYLVLIVPLVLPAVLRRIRR